MKKQVLLLGALCALPLDPMALGAAEAERPLGASDIVFVCEHGSAKSVVAAAHFNRLAARRGLPFRAVARGVRPDESLAPAAVAGLRQDQLEPPAARPLGLTPADLESVRRVIAFSALPEEFEISGEIEIWTVPPVSEGYAAARDAMVRRLEGLLDELAARPK